ncbi:glutathione peroxidase [Streptomyces catenulae]|uniref:Glutathione peroxidase n=1 Tax=Streptomyces catenulae TaxID=66875 RepID=A0ABV2Z4I3_9ACTN|nr:glutathione peroxidase [Streptomyces catenulae]
MSVHTVEIDALQGGPADLAQYRGKAVLLVNVASRCGLTPQYAALERLHAQYAPRGFTVLGVPCNQFMGQEPGTADEIAQFRSATYGVTFPMTEKIDVNGAARHALYTRGASRGKEPGGLGGKCSAPGSGRGRCALRKPRRPAGEHDWRRPSA